MDIHVSQQLLMRKHLYLGHETHGGSAFTPEVLAPQYVPVGWWGVVGWREPGRSKSRTQKRVIQFFLLC